MLKATINLTENVELIPARPEQAPLLANLLELYSYDFSTFINLDLDANGRFGYAFLPALWTEPGHYPFLVQVNDHPAGFAFLRRGSQISGEADVWDMMEFFVVRRYRRYGVGMEIAHRIWKRFPGNWEIRGDGS